MTHPVGFFYGDELERRPANARRDRAFHMREPLARGGHRPRSRKAAAAVVGGAALLGLASFASLRPAGTIPLGSISPSELTAQTSGLPTADPADAH
jgi:hypothetical protein